MIILSVADYLRNILKKSGLVAEIQEDAQKTGFDRITDQEVMAKNSFGPRLTNWQAIQQELFLCTPSIHFQKHSLNILLLL